MNRRVLAAVVLLAPAAGFPCTIRRPTHSGLAPTDGATLVPLNAEVKFIACDPLTWTFVDGAGNAVPVTQSMRGPTTVLQPVTPLSPDTRYTLTLTDTSSSMVATSTFNTGQSLDEAPPTLSGNPTVKTYSSKNDLFAAPCGPSESSTFAWPVLSDEVTPASDLMIEAFLGEEPDALGMEPALVTQTGTLRVGSTLCGGTYFISDKRSVLLKARAVDWAGNFSALTETEQVKGCGCNAGGPLLALGAVALLLRRRRR